MLAPTFAALLAVTLPAQLGFREAIDRAVTQSPGARSTQAVVDAAEGRFQQVRAAALPRVTLGAAHVWLASKALDDVHADARLSSTLGVATLSLPVLDARAWLDTKEARDDVDLATADAQLRRRALALAAGRAWIAARTEQHALATRLEAQRTAQLHLAFVRGRAEHGAATQLDELRAQRELATVTAQVQTALAASLRAREVLGLAVGADQPVEASDEDLATLVLPSEVSERPDVARALAAWRLASDGVAHGWADYAPTLTLTGQAFAQDVPTASLPVSGLGLSALLVLSVPLYDGGRRVGAQRVRNAQLMEAASRAQQVSQRAEAERRSGLDTQAHARQALDDTRAAAAFAHRALELTQARYREGVGTGLDVIDALREARDADLQVALAEDRLQLASLDVLAATGHLD